MQNSLEKAQETLVYGKKSVHPDCIVLMGLPGSGKSHVSRYLHARYGYTVLSGENITYALFGDTRCQVEQYKEVYHALYKLAQELLDIGYSIVIDGTNLQYAHRKQAYDAVGNRAKVFGIHLIVDESVAIQRIKARGENSSDSTNILSQCSSETFSAFVESMEPAREGENIHEVLSDDDIFESLDEIIVRMDA